MAGTQRILRTAARMLMRDDQRRGCGVPKCCGTWFGVTELYRSDLDLQRIVADVIADTSVRTIDRPREAVRRYCCSSFVAKGGA